MYLYIFDKYIHILYVNICVLFIYKFINIVWKYNLFINLFRVRTCPIWLTFDNNICLIDV